MATPFRKDVLRIKRNTMARANPKIPKPKNKKLSNFSPVKYLTIGFMAYNLKNILFILNKKPYPNNLFNKLYNLASFPAIYLNLFVPSVAAL